MKYLLILALALSACMPPVAPARPAAATPTLPQTATATITATSTARPVVRMRVVLTATPGSCVVSNTSGDVLNIRRGPGTDREIVGGLLPGARVMVIAWGDAWLKIPGGYIARRYCKEVRGK